MDLLKVARDYALGGHYILSLEKYMNYFTRTPQELRDKTAEYELVNILCDLDIFFGGAGQEELLKCFCCCVLWFPENAKLKNRFGSFLVKNGLNVDGLRFILQAYKIAQERTLPCLSIENNMLHLMWSQVPRWHFRMLNGKLRNDSYRTAIHRALDSGKKHVIDIGSGCGLLSLYAGTHRSGPSVMTFESSPVLYKKGAMILSKYCADIDYKCYNSLSYLVQEIHKPKRDLLITEIFDVAVFGEGILKTLDHAYKVFMQPTGYSVVPASVTMYVCGISCKNIDKKYRLQGTIPGLLDGNICVTKSLEDDPYDAENIKKEKFEFVTSVLQFMHLKFANQAHVRFLYEGNWKYRLQLPVIRKGVVDCLLVWFDLHLDSETVISTNPYQSNCEPCWEQAIFHCKHPVPVNVGENLKFDAKLENEHFKFEMINEANCDSKKCFELSDDAIRFLNDKEWVKCLYEVSQTISENEKLKILDFCAFPLVGLLLAEKGHEVVHFFKEEKDVTFFQYLIAKNKIEPDKVTLLEYNKYPQYVAALEKVDYAIFEPISQDGSMRPSPMDNITFKKFHAKNIFEEIIVHFEVIYSPYLDYCNKVKLENVFPFQEIATEMNEYTGSEHPCLPHDFPHEKMTSEQTWNVKTPYTIETVKALKSGKINGILTWYTLIGKNRIQFCTKESSNFSKNVLLCPEKFIDAEEVFKMFCQYEAGGFYKIDICQDMWLRTNFERFTNNSCFIEYFKNNYSE